MRYEEARPMIQTGDLIAVKRRSGPLAIGTRLVTGSPYTHTAIAVWVNVQSALGRRLLIAHSTAGGDNLVPLSQEAEYAFDVFDCPVDRAPVEYVMWSTFGSRIGYGYLDLARIFLHLTFGVPLPAADDGDKICSATSAMLYQASGWHPANLPSIPWPGAIVDAIGAAPKLQVTP